MGQDQDYTLVKLSSGETRKILSKCRATIGQLSNVDNKNKKIGKAGRNRWLGKRPRVRGVAMNAVDHPHGSGRKQTIGINSTVSRNAPPGRKVGHIAAKRTGAKR